VRTTGGMLEVPWLDRMFAYTTPKRIKVQYWQLGVFYYSSIILIAAFYGQNMFSGGEYLKKVEITGAINAYAETGSHPSTTCRASGTCTSVGNQLLTAAYCSSANHHFIYSDDFKYQSQEGSSIGPICREDSLYELNLKRQNYISFSTVYTESQEFAWPCSESSEPYALEWIAACGGTATQDPAFPTQCECKSTRAVFPAAVEDYTVVLTHAYQVTNLMSESWSGSSTTAQADLTPPNHPVDSTFHFPNGTELKITGGDPIKLTLREILAMAGRDLNARNTFVAAESGDSTNQPTFRHTGMEILVTLDYTNRLGTDPMLGPVNRDVDVTVVQPKVVDGWKSNGPKTFYPVYPIGVAGSQKFHKVIQYPQDIEIKFAPTGYAYAFDALHAVQTLIDLFVLASIAKGLVDIIVFFCIPNVSIVLRNKRDEATSRRMAFRELGMRAAISVNQFHRINNDAKRPDINLQDLVKVFGSVSGVAKEEALNIAQTILSSKSTRSLTFNDFMEITEGSTIKFQDFLELVAYTAKQAQLDKVSQDEVAKAKAAYDVEEQKAAQGIMLDDEPAPATPPQQQQVVQQVAGPQQVIMQMPMQQPVQQRPALPPGVIKLACGQCRKHFGVPAGATMVKCPFCGALNNTAAASGGVIQAM